MLGRLGRIGRALAIVATATVLAQAAPPALEAQSSRQERRARVLFERGIESADQERWIEAAEYFRRAARLAERPSILFNLGYSLWRAGKPSEAIPHLERFLDVADPRRDAADIATAREVMRDAHARLGTLTLTISPADAQIEVDGRMLDVTGEQRRLLLDPGRHVVTARADGHRTMRFEVSALPGTVGRRELTLQPLRADASTPPPNESPPLDDAAPLDPATVAQGAPPPGEPSSHTERDATREPTQERDGGGRGALWAGLGAGAGAVLVVVLAVALSGGGAKHPLDGYGGSAGVRIEALLPP